LNYLHDGKKVPAGQPLAKLFAVDWFVDYKRMDDVCSRPAGTCQRYLLGTKRGSNTSFVFAVNIQVPGARHFSIIYYYVLAAPVDAVIAYWSSSVLPITNSKRTGFPAWSLHTWQ